MDKKIAVLIVDENSDVRDHIRSVLKHYDDFAIVGEVAGGEDGIQLAENLEPDIVLVSLSLTDMDGLQAAETITGKLANTAVVVMSVRNERKYLKRAMLAGARDFLFKPFSAANLVQTLRKVYGVECRRRGNEQITGVNYDESDDDFMDEAESRVIAVCGTKGGIGKTTIATNLAVAVHQSTQQPVALVDLDLQFGDVSVFLDLSPRMTIGEMAMEVNGEDDEEILERYMSVHSSGVHVLAAPSRPEYAEYVKANHVGMIIKLLQGHYRYIVIDTPPQFGDVVLAAMDSADYILMVTNLEMSTLRGTKIALDITRSLNYNEDRVKVVLNRATENWGIKPKEAELTLGRDFWGQIPSDLKTVATSVNWGVPLVIGQAKGQAAQGIRLLAGKIIGRGNREKPRMKRGLFKIGMFSLGSN